MEEAPDDSDSQTPRAPPWTCCWSRLCLRASLAQEATRAAARVRSIGWSSGVSRVNLDRFGPRLAWILKFLRIVPAEETTRTAADLPASVRLRGSIRTGCGRIWGPGKPHLPCLVGSGGGEVEVGRAARRGSDGESRGRRGERRLPAATVQVGWD